MGNDIVKQCGVTYNFSSTVRPASRQVIEDAITEICEKSWKNHIFFEELNVDVYGNWSESKDFKNFSYWINGVTYPRIANKGSRMGIKTNKEFKYEFNTIFSSEKDPLELKQTTMHELGHVFDSYFATPDKNIENCLMELLADEKEGKPVDEDEIDKLFEIYNKQDGLSDSEEFREAWRQDVEINFKGNSRIKNSIKLDKLGYYSPLFDFSSIGNSNTDTKIKLEDGIDEIELDAADLARGEIFAMLFAYAMGMGIEDKQKELLMSVYQNSYKVVNSFINKYLGTNEIPSTNELAKCLDCQF